MIRGIGMDVVEIQRFEEALERHGERLRNRLFTRAEQEYCDAHPNPGTSYAARFAAKEAVAKALGTGIAGGIQWIDIEVVRDSAGRPSIILHRRARVVFAELRGQRVWLSMTHSRLVAAANAVIEGT